MSLDKLIAAATDYFSTGAEVHRATLLSIADHQNAIIEYHKTSSDVNRRALAGGGGNITEMSETKAEKPATKTVATKAKDTPAPVEKPMSEAVTDVVVKPVAPAPAPAAAAPAPVEDDLGGAPVIDYEADIRPLIRTKTLINREGLIALLGTFGVKSGAELSQVQHADFLAALQAL